jgi:signal-transduction protein with cAMP-binding, CBS, and nucleotidyltransferase domain
MYFIEKGEVEVLSQDELTVIIKLNAGQYFGEGSLLFAEPRATTIRHDAFDDLKHHFLSFKYKTMCL